jgi:hypothetical protein
MRGFSILELAFFLPQLQYVIKKLNDFFSFFNFLYFIFLEKDTENDANMSRIYFWGFIYCFFVAIFGFFFNFLFKNKVKKIVSNNYKDIAK